MGFFLQKKMSSLVLWYIQVSYFLKTKQFKWLFITKYQCCTFPLKGSLFKIKILKKNLDSFTLFSVNLVQLSMILRNYSVYIYIIYIESAFILEKMELRVTVTLYLSCSFSQFTLWQSRRIFKCYTWIEFYWKKITRLLLLIPWLLT